MYARLNSMHQLFTSRLKRITSEGQGAASNVQPTSVRLHRVGSVFPRHSMPIMDKDAKYDLFLNESKKEGKRGRKREKKKEEEKKEEEKEEEKKKVSRERKGENERKESG
ncbi:hypothetical protein M8J77_024976 [Diaphorina citri]|nr:hypothetical protein M8J77_024976 [Diaphorina citri]